MFVLPLQTFVHASQIFLSSEQALLSLTITLKAAPYELIRETTYQSELLLLDFFLIKAERQSLITMKKKNTRHSKRPHCGSLASLNCTVDEGNQWLLVPPALFKMRAGKITNEEEGTVQWHRTSTYSVYCNTTTLSTHNQPIMVRQQQTN